MTTLLISLIAQFILGIGFTMPIVPLHAQDSELATFERHPLIVETDSGKKIQLDSYLARSPQQHYHGLSYSTRLTPDKSMLFIFHPSRPHIPFVMRDMNYPLDISFFDENGDLISGFYNLQPCIPEKLCPEVAPDKTTPVAYVLETVPQTPIVKIFLPLSW